MTFGLVVGLVGGTFGLFVGLVAGVMGIAVGLAGTVLGLAVAAVVLAAPVLLVVALFYGAVKLVRAA
jgi:hypothetical protein